MFFLAVDDVVISTCSPETAAFTLPTDTLCINDAAVTPVVTGTTGGWFYGTAGLNINQITGEIDPLTSTPGDHILYYVTSMTDCADTSMVEIVIDNCGVGLEESLLAGVELYPNPTNGLLNVSLPVEGVAVSVTDFAGKEVVAAVVVAGQTTQLDLSALNNGIYFVQFRVNGAKETRRVVLTK
jgi:hypothetical protein